MRTHYDNLHITETAGLEVIKAAYKALAQKWHPDKNHDQREKAERVFKIITRAYEVVSDPALRRKYDDWLKEQRSVEPDEPEPEAVSEPPTKNRSERTTEAWADGKRSREQGFSSSDCPHDGDLADAWRAGFNAGKEGPEQARYRTPKPAINERYPWRRFFARFVDTFSMSLASMFIVSFLAAFLFGVDLTTYWADSWFAWFFLIVGFLIVTETIFIHLFAATPGKWLFGVRVYFHDGTKLSLNNSLERAMSAFFIGQAANIPGLVVITNLIAYNKLKKTGSTAWDERSKSRVECAPMSAGRGIACVLVTLIVIIANSELMNAQIKESAKSAVAQDQSVKVAAATPWANYQQQAKTSQLDPSTAQLDTPAPASAPQQAAASAQSATDAHFAQIYSAHPDATSIADSPQFIQWVKRNKERMRAYKDGSTAEVITLLNEYKSYIKQDAKSHGENVRLQNSAPITSKMADAILGSTQARSGSSSPPGCVFREFMDDEDYRACGITPP